MLFLSKANGWSFSRDHKTHCTHPSDQSATQQSRVTKRCKKVPLCVRFFLYIFYILDISSYSTNGYTGVLWQIKTWTYHLQPNNILQLFDCIYYLWSNWELIDSDWEGDTYTCHLQELIRHNIIFILIILPEEMIVSLGEKRGGGGGQKRTISLTFIWPWISLAFRLAKTWMWLDTCFRERLLPVRSLMYLAINSFRPVREWQDALC